jgi:formylglycine-generating enzyme required for sulfatase activity
LLSVSHRRPARQLALLSMLSIPLALAAVMPTAAAQDVPPAKAEGSEAATEKEMKAYTDQIPGTEVKFDLLPIVGGTFVMGSPAGEADRAEDEGPQHEVKVSPFWMGKYEVTWNEYDVWSFNLDIQSRKINKIEPSALDKLSDIVTRPTKPYTDMTFDMGHDNFPAICMTHLAAATYCKWLSAKTGRYYRLPTEAEWEYACRAGTKTAYSFGDDKAKLKEYAWNYDNSGDKYHKVGQKKPNPWGLYDMHGNVCEWVQDQYVPDFFAQFAGKPAVVNPLSVPKKEYPMAVKGGSWDDDAEKLRSAARRGSEPDWKIQDPQIPKSIWYFTDARFVGFRVVRPLEAPAGWREKLLKEMEEAKKNAPARN